MADWQDLAEAISKTAQAQQPAQVVTTWTKGRVTSTAPLRVRKFGARTPIPLDPVDLVGTLAVDDVVWLQVTDGYVVVHGRIGG